MIRKHKRDIVKDEPGLEACFDEVVYSGACVVLSIGL